MKPDQVQHDLNKEAAKISASPTEELDIYEYLVDEDLGHKPWVVEQTKVEYSPLGTVFNKRLKKEDKMEWLLKKLKTNVKDKQQLKTVKDEGEK